jgi:hypothetical protein
MTRKEQIMDAAMFFAKKNKNNPIPYLDYVEAAEWADRTMLARICEWLEDHDITKHISVIYSGACSINFDKQGLFDALCKAMEE